MPNTYLIPKIHANACMLGENPCAELKFNTCHYIPNTCQYIPRHTTIHTKTYHYTCQIHTNKRLVQHTGFRPAYKYWHVSWYVLVCIVQKFGMYYVMILVNSSKYINTYQYVKYIPFFLYIPIILVVTKFT